MRYTEHDLADVRLSRPVNLQDCKKVWMEAVFQADALFERFPPAEMGCLYLDTSGQPVCPDPDSADFVRLVRHFGCVKGAWPALGAGTEGR